MPKIICTVPEKRQSTEDLLDIQSQLINAYCELFSESNTVDVFWSLLPKGQS